MLKAVQLGRNSGLRVSELCLGTMNFGKPGRGHQGDWTLDLDAARPIFQAAIEHGLFYFDCADVYGIGACARALAANSKPDIMVAVGPWMIIVSSRLGLRS